jgi:hypothetical protein
MQICGQSLPPRAMRYRLSRHRRPTLPARHSLTLTTREWGLQTARDVITLHVIHGGPRQTGKPDEPGASKTRNPARLATTLSLPTLQHGHKPTSSLATRAKNAWADSMACGLDCGICKAARATASFTPLQLDANTP